MRLALAIIISDLMTLIISSMVSTLRITPPYGKYAHKLWFIKSTASENLFAVFCL